MSDPRVSQAVAVCLEPDCGQPVRRNRKGHGLGRCSLHLGKNHPKARPVGSKVIYDGYVKIKQVDGSWIGEHRLIMCDYLGRDLVKGETVHHVNGIRTDNRLQNLELWWSQPAGQRVSDLIDYVVREHREELLRALCA